MRKIKYPEPKEVVDYNKKILEKIKVKKADQHKVSSPTKLNKNKQKGEKMKTQKFEITIESKDGFIDISNELANHIEEWLQISSPHDKIKVSGEYMNEESDECQGCGYPEAKCVCSKDIEER